MTKRKRKAVFLRLPEHVLIMLEELQEEFKLENRTLTIEFAIGFFYAFWPCTKVFSDMLAQQAFQHGKKTAIHQRAHISMAFTEFMAEKYKKNALNKAKKEVF